jgi:hypothetical protein
MSWAVLLLLGAMGVFVGVLVGAIGIGGVLLVPILTYFVGIDVHVAIAAAIFSYLFSGAVGAVLYARRGSIRWGMAAWLFLGAMPAAFLGAATVSTMPGKFLELLIAILIVFAGANALRSAAGGDKADRVLGGPALAAIGAITGFGSAMTGTGGPLLLVPILVWLRIPVLTAVGLSQAIQLPIAALASVGNFVYGRIDFGIGLVIAAALVAGVSVGAHLAHAVSQAVLRRVVAWVLVAVGLFIIVRIVYV